MSVINVRAVDFALYHVANLDRSLAFYTDVLGLPAGERWKKWVEVEAPNMTIAVALLDDPPEKPDRSAVALAVDDVDEAIKNLKAAAVTVVHGPDDDPVCRHASILDPDGNMIWIHGRKDGTAG